MRPFAVCTNLAFVGYACFAAWSGARAAFAVAADKPVAMVANRALDRLVDVVH